MLDQYFAFKCKKGLKERLSKLPYKVDEDEYNSRLDYELGVIRKMEYPGYFLVVQDFINWAKKQGILVGPGRGSGAGALCCYALGITNVDPIKYGLIFERFLNPARVSMPDIDVDFPKFRRQEVIKYTADKYGHVAQIGTFGTYKGKGAIEAAARVLGLPISVGEKLRKLYPPPLAGKPHKLVKAYELSADLKKFREGNGPESRILQCAEQIEGRISSFGIHASGVVIADKPLSDQIPLALGKHGETVTQWEMNNVEESGLIKFDFLGLKNLDVITLCLELINQRHGKEIDIYNLALDDEETYVSLCKGDNIGVFQLESSSGMRDLMIKIQPENIEDLAALVAMYRPGPMKSPKMQDYLEWRAGRAGPQYLHPDLEPILSNTGGWIVYQEQVLQIARDLAGYSLTDADLLRRAVGKKKEKEMAEHQQQFNDGLLDRGYTADLAYLLWEDIKAFADYGFNKSHALAYAVISYWCAYLKTHYPLEFMSAALTCDTGNQDQIIIYLQECKRMGVEILPPDVNESQDSFYPSESSKSIRFGFSATKNIGQAPAEHILEVRKQHGKFKDIFDFASAVDLGKINKTKLESLVLAGAFDFMGYNRNTLLTGVDAILDHKKKRKSYEKKLETYQKKTDAYLERLKDIEDGKLSDKGKRLKPLKEPVKPEIPPAPTLVELDEIPAQEKLLHEKLLTGYFITGHPLDKYQGKDFNSTSIRTLKMQDISDVNKKDYGAIVCIISDVQEIQSKKTKQPMAFVRMEDLTGTMEGVVFPNIYTSFRKEIQKNLPVKIYGKIQYTYVETDEGNEDILIPSMIIDAAEPLDTIELHERFQVEIPLMLDIPKKLYKIMQKYKGEDASVQIKFKTSSDVKLTARNVFGISNETRKFRTEIHKISG